MYQSYIIKMSIFLLLILKCHIIGAQRHEDLSSYEVFLDKLVAMVQQQLHERLKVNMYYVELPDYLKSMSGRSIKLGRDHLVRIFGLNFKFLSNGKCNMETMDGQNTLSCPVRFDDLQIQLPPLEYGGTVYVVHVTINGTLVLKEGTKHMQFQQFIWLYEHYEMMDSDWEPVNPPPAAYCLKVKSPLGLKGILQTKLQKLIEDGVFRDAVVSSLEKIPKPTDMIGH
uniref:Putative secreted protein n=1 Tax=Ixodes ricinus TaxID=34613 RepID=A0A090X9L1_IXORI